MIRKILVPVRGDGKGDNVLAHAAALARGFNAHIEITHCRAKPENLLPFGVPIPAALRAQLVESTSQVFDIEEAGLRGEVLALSKTLNIRMSKKADGKSVTANFVEEAGRQIDVIGHHGRLADIIAVAKPDIDRNLGANTLKAALFNTGRPVLMRSCVPLSGRSRTANSLIPDPAVSPGRVWTILAASNFSSPTGVTLRCTLSPSRER